MALEPLALTVSEITRRIKHSLESSFGSIVVQGEISNFKRHTSGHIYFTLKDDASQISAVLWRSRAHALSFPAEDGMKVVVTGRLTVYEVRGAYQIEVSSIRPVGIGELQIAFEYLKRKLAAEGLFDPDHKKPLPEYPDRIGIITSPTGAALHDILNILQRRFPAVEVLIRPTIVQGGNAVPDIVEALEDLNRVGGVDVVILGRGGGSMEDLWAFNEEAVARAIFSSSIPVVSAIGHEIDFTIADFVADLRAPTPSAAAELVVRDRKDVLAKVHQYWYTMHESLTTMLNHRKEHVRHLLHTYSFNKPIDLLRQHSQRVDEFDRGLTSAVSHRLALLKASSASLDRRIAALDPNMVLKRGYTMVYREGEVVSSSARLRPSDEIQIKFKDGTLPSKIL